MSNLIKNLEKILGKQNVLKEQEELYCYAYDSGAIGDELYLPDVVILPKNTEQISKIVKLADEFNTPIVTRGAGTNMVGACIPTKGGIVLHTSKMDKILNFNPENHTCVVQPGITVEKVQLEAEKHGLFYPPDPSNLKVSTIGGSVALSSSGPRCMKYGGTKDYILGLEAVLANGEIIKTGGSTIKNVTGYNLTQLLVGSEGTLGIITEITLKLIPKPNVREVMLAFFDDIENAVKTVNEIISNNLIPSTLDLIDKNTIQTIEKFHPTGVFIDSEAALIIEMDGFKELVKQQAEKIKSICNQNNCNNFKISTNKEEYDKIWFARRSSFGAVAKLKPNVITEDAVVPRDKLVDMLKKIQEISKKYNLTTCIMGHAGDGNLHPNYALDLRDTDEVKRFEMASEELFQAAISLGGTLSGEHGIGLMKTQHIDKAIDKVTLSCMKNIKKVFDPKNLLNPGKGI